MKTERKIITAQDLRDAVGEVEMEEGKPFSKIRELLDFFSENSDIQVDYCNKYGEPGYTDPVSGILFGDWNYIDKEAGTLLDEWGFETEWSDEWTTVNDKAYGIHANSYDWQPQLHLTEDGEYITPDDDVQTWIDEMKDTPTKALPEWITQAQLEELGWERHEERFENGFHHGQNDMPKPIYDKLIKRDDVESVVFRICDKGQFDVKFEAYILPREIPEGDDE